LGAVAHFSTPLIPGWEEMVSALRWEENSDAIFLKTLLGDKASPGSAERNSLLQDAVRPKTGAGDLPWAGQGPLILK
jgi:hypothetical protein